MTEDERQILENIVENDGSCTQWANKQICEQCPMSRLKKRSNGSYYSCFEAICVTELSEEDADARYDRAAVRLLMDISIEDMLIKE